MSCNIAGQHCIGTKLRKVITRAHKIWHPPQWIERRPLMYTAGHELGKGATWWRQPHKPPFCQSGQHTKELLHTKHGRDILCLWVHDVHAVGYKTMSNKLITDSALFVPRSSIKHTDAARHSLRISRAITCPSEVWQPQDWKCHVNGSAPDLRTPDLRGFSTPRTKILHIHISIHLADEMYKCTYIYIYRHCKRSGSTTCKD